MGNHEQSRVSKKEISEIYNISVNVKRHVIVLLLLIFFPLVLEKEFVQVINFAFVNPLFSRFEHSIWLDILALCFLLILAFKFYQVWIKKPFLSITTIVYSLILWLIYFLLFYNTTYWKFLGVFDSGIPYFHLLFLLPVCLGILKIRHWLWEKPQITTSLSLADDAPITELEDDDLSRSQSATKIASHIIATHPKKSFALAICAEWGSGKTSYINMVYDAIFKEDKSVIWIRFEPWLSQGNDHIIPDFLKELESALVPYNPRIGRIIREYSQSISALKKNTLVENLHDITSFVNRPGTIRELYSSLNESIKNINRKIVIEIDDIDRLDNEEIVEVLRLIRNTGSFSNSFYLCAFDREYILGALAKINEHKSVNYLEKIFQAEVNLPRFDRNVLRKQLLSKLSGILEDDDLKILGRLFDSQNKGDDIFSLMGVSSGFSNHASSLCIHNLRDVIRLANNIKLVYTKDLRSEILLDEFFKVQILRLKYAKELDLFYQNYTQILVKTSLQTDTFLTLDKKTILEGKTEDNSFYLSFVEELKNKNTHKLNFFLSELLGLFPSQDGNNTSILSLQWLSRFHIIFGINLIGEYFSENNFQKYLRKEFDKEEYYNVLESRRSRLQLLSRLYEIKNYESKDQFLLITQLWFLLIEKADVEIAGVKSILFYKDPLKAVFAKLEGYTRKEYLDQFWNWIDSIQPVSKRSIILNELTIQLIYDEGKEDFIFAKNELLDRLVEILAMYINENDLDEETITLHSKCIKSIEKETRLIKVDERANEKLRIKISERPVDYLKSLIIPLRASKSGIEYTFHPFANQVFGNEEKFEDWLFSITSSHPEMKIIKTIYDRVKSNEQLNAFKFEDYQFSRPSWVLGHQIQNEDH